MQALARMRARPVYKGSQRVSAHLLLCTVAGNGSVHYAGGHHFSFSTDLDERWTASQVCANWPGICSVLLSETQRCIFGSCIACGTD